MPMESALMFVWYVFSIKLQLLKICNCLLITLHLLALYDNVLTNRRLSEFKLTLIYAYGFKKTHTIETNNRIEIYSELFT